MKKMKNCPDCEGKAEMHQMTEPTTDSYRITCNDCGLTTSGRHSEAGIDVLKDMLVENWNMLKPSKDMQIKRYVLKTKWVEVA